MDYRIAGRVALVVGGSKGIGLETARYLATEGARVAIVARTPKPIDDAVAAIAACGPPGIQLAPGPLMNASRPNWGAPR